MKMITKHPIASTRKCFCFPPTHLEGGIFLDEFLFKFIVKLFHPENCGILRGNTFSDGWFNHQLDLLEGPNGKIDRKGWRS